MIYEYECSKCGRKAEMRIDIMEDVVKATLPFCMRCDQYMDKIISPCNAHFKGPGFTKSVGEKNG